MPRAAARPRNSCEKGKLSAVIPSVELAAHHALPEDISEAGLPAIILPDRLHRDWRAARALREVGVAAGCWRGCGPLPLSSRSATSTRRPCRDSMPSSATRSSRSASTALANRATSPTSTAPMASTPRRSSTPPPAPAYWRSIRTGYSGPLCPKVLILGSIKLKSREHLLCRDIGPAPVQCGGFPRGEVDGGLEQRAGSIEGRFVA